MIIPNIWENKKCSKPPTIYIYIYGKLTWVKPIVTIFGGINIQLYFGYHPGRVH